MRRAWIDEPGVVSLRATPVPQPGPGEVRVRSRRVGICGSDLHALAGRHPFVDLPVSPGHEVAGVVAAVGEDVDSLAVGDRVLLEPNLVCGRCQHCSTGRYNLCERLRVVGCQTAGALADAFVAPAERFHVVPAGMSMRAAALVEPLSTATHAIRLAGGVSGAVVAVLGAGTIGLGLLLAARAAGAAGVAVTDPLRSKRERARRLGADMIVDPNADDVVTRIRSGLAHRPDVIFDCVAHQVSIDSSIALALNGGTVVVVGVPSGPVRIPLQLVQDRELRLQGTAMYVSSDVLRAIDLVADAPLDELVTAELPLEHAARAFEAAGSGEHVKVHVVIADD
ncbi:MAG: alcohol dehydrogenase catalytic domain-containing protein [Actinomycetota bacterium]|jgi:2-desacetyl-2-hydroxyethyl bacteriochlorophyllide A dehydrogenase|nr:alcohol dehydrogenase catalytic domain-containing protein [Actinomycetota bacterium]